MNFLRTKIDEVKTYYRDYYKTLEGGFDDYYEDQIRESNHYKVDFENHIIGVFAVNNDNRLICLYVTNEYKYMYEEVFERIIKFDSVSSIMTITNDTMMINEILRRNFKIIKQAYNFKYRGSVHKSSFKMRKANLEDVETMKVLFKDFFDDYEDRVKTSSLYLGYKNNKIISLGNIQNHIFNPNVVSVGMIVVESERLKGYATETLKYLIQEGLSSGRIVQAGCWFYNHASKNTLLKAGLSLANMIIRVDEF